MRISDWSSDVCSSDLIDAVERPVAPDATPRRRLVERELLALRGKPERVLDTANSIQKLGRQPIGEELEGKVRERVAERRYFPVEDRSEEHTSELQSLMRISYAVFCLTKKTKQTRTQHRHTIT